MRVGWKKAQVSYCKIIFSWDIEKSFRSKHQSFLGVITKETPMQG